MADADTSFCLLFDDNQIGDVTVSNSTYYMEEVLIYHHRLKPRMKNLLMQRIENRH